MRGIRRNQLRGGNCYEMPCQRRRRGQRKEDPEPEPEVKKVDVPIVMLTPKFDGEMTIAQFKEIEGNKDLAPVSVSCDVSGWQQVIGPENTQAFAVSGKKFSRVRKDDNTTYKLFITNNIDAEIQGSDEDKLTFTMFMKNVAGHLGKNQDVVPFIATFQSFWTVFSNAVVAENDNVRVGYGTSKDAPSHITFDWEGRLAWNASKKLEFN